MITQPDHPDIPEEDIMGQDPKVERKKKIKQGMNKVKDLIVQLLAGSIVKDIGDAADKVFTSKEEKQQVLNEAEQIYNERLKLLYQMTNQDVDSWLSKNVRPLIILISMVTLSSILILKIDVDADLLGKYVTWNGIMVSFYFGVRELVKAQQRKKNNP